MFEIILTIFICWSIVGLLIFGILNVYDNYIAYAITFDDWLNPISIYKRVTVNWFGCIRLTLFSNLLCPIITICFWFYKLCIVGRKG